MAMTTTVFKFKEESKGEKKRASCNIVYEITGTFRTEYENEIEYENDFPILISHIPRTLAPSCC